MGGIFQIVGFVVFIIFLATKGPGIIRIIPSLLLGIVDVVLAVIVVVGGVKMRRLKDYRFCRMSCMLAVLPLYGVLLCFSIDVLWGGSFNVLDFGAIFWRGWPGYRRCLGPGVFAQTRSQSSLRAKRPQGAAFHTRLVRIFRHL